MIVRSIERRSFTEWHLVAAPPEGVRGEAARLVFAELASQVARAGIEPVQQKLYGSRAARHELLAAWRDALRGHGLDPTLPATFVEGAPVLGEGLAGVELFGLSRRGGAGKMVETVALGEGAGGRVGRAWRVAGGRFLYVPGLDGRGPEGLPEDPAAQCEAAFTQAESALASQGLAFPHLVRTWFHLSRLLDWYDRFNEFRTRRYREAGMIVEGAPPAVPASTAIQGRSTDEECLFELLACDPGPAIELRRIRETARQGAAYAYGPAFLRGLALGIEGRRTVYVSGTASIDRGGATVHVGDAEHQVLHTLLCVAALLEEQGGSLERLLSGTLFCKTPAVHEAYRRVTRQLGLPPLPLVPVIADVCRGGLLVELEAVGSAG